MKISDTETYIKIDDDYVNQKELKFYDGMYTQKKKLDDKNIIFYINDEDLIKFNDDTDEILYLRIIKENDEIKTKPNHNIQLPRAITCPPSMQKNNKPTKIASPRDKTIKVPKTFSKNITIDNIIYTLYYKDTNDLYATFKIKKKDDKIYCTGTFDHKIVTSVLINNNYQIKNIKHNDFNYELFLPNFDGFVSPMYVQCMQCKMSCSTDVFMNIFINLMGKH